MSKPTLDSFNLKMSMLSLSELDLNTNNLNKILLTLEKKADIAADFLRDSPVIINCKNIPSKEQNIDFKELIKLLKSYEMKPIGFKNTTEKQSQQAETAGLISIKETLKKSKSEIQNKTKQPPQEAEKPKPSYTSVPAKIVKGSIRSGQQVISQGDLIIIGSVSATAEALAVGNIHIYGALRGRALAGIGGNQNTLIYCQKMQAELVSIAGVYQLSEDMPNDLDNTPILVQSLDAKIVLTSVK